MKPLIVGLSILVASMEATPQERSETAQYRGPAGDAEHLRFVHVNGVRLAYRMEGAGFPVIFVHGEGYSHELWTEQIEAFRQRHLFLSYDRRGHGQSEDPVTGYSEIAHAEDLNALMTYFGMREAHFVVNSRGGAVIMQFLRIYPERVRSITFADATIALAEISDAFKPAVERLKGPPPSLEEALKGREGAKKSSFTKVAQSKEETRAVLERMVDQYSPRVVMNPQRSDQSSPTHIGPWNRRDFPDMSKIHQPMLLVVGELTDIFFIEGAQEAHRLWPNTRYHMIPGTDHLLVLEAPDVFNSFVLDFLADVDAQVAARDDWVGQVP